jgi:hypothetical protein
MEVLELKELLHRQQDQILTLQILLQSLVDDLVESGVIDESKLDNRLNANIKVIKDQMDKMRKEQKHMEYQFGFGPMGEA